MFDRANHTKQCNIFSFIGDVHPVGHSEIFNAYMVSVFCRKKLDAPSFVPYICLDSSIDNSMAFLTFNTCKINCL